MPDTARILSIVLVSCHLEEGPEAIPLGAASVAASIKHHFGNSVSVRLAEAFVKDGRNGILKAVCSAPGDMAGFSLYSWNREIMVSAAEEIRLNAKAPFLFCGGPEAGANPRGLLVSEGGPFDSLITGEGELAALNLVGDYREGKKIPELLFRRIIPEENLAQLPSPWLDGTLDAEKRSGVLWELTRGCPYNCIYCYESKGDRSVRFFSGDRIGAELEYFSRKKPASVFVLDPTFNTDKERASKILHAILKAAPDIHWHFEVRGELLNREQAKLFGRLNASLQIGLQSQDFKVCSQAGRSFNRELFASKISLLHEEGVAFGLDIIYGLPGDSLPGYRKSLDFALSLYPDNLDMFRLSVLPGTVLYDRAEELGLDASKQAPYGIISGKTFPEADLHAAERLSRAADIFYNKGRAVAWFNQLLYPLEKKPSQFLGSFAAFLEGQKTRAVPGDSLEIEKLQLAFLDTCYTAAKKEYLLPLVWDIVRFHGAWGRALAEGMAAELDCSYHIDELLDPGSMDIEDAEENLEPFKCTVQVRPGRGKPEYSIV